MLKDSIICNLGQSNLPLYIPRGFWSSVNVGCLHLIRLNVQVSYKYKISEIKK